MGVSENVPTNSSTGEEEEEEDDEEEEVSSEGEFDTPENPQLPDPNSKALDQSKQARSKTPVSRYSPPPLKQPTGKRPASDAETSDFKRVKNNTTEMTSPDGNNGGEKKQLFQRLWSEDNEIELIQGMISYVEEKGKDPVADVNDFHEFVRKSLHVDVNDRQMLAKARRLKKKFLNNAAIVESKGKVRSFSNPHEKRMYEFSKNLWGNDSNKKAVMGSCSKKLKVKVNVTPKTNKSSRNGDVGIQVAPDQVDLKKVQPLPAVGGLGIPITDEGIMNKGFELVAGPKKVEMEEKWKSLKMLELEHFMKKMDVLKEQAEVVLNAIANSVAK